jgi:hypothetical protein
MQHYIKGTLLSGFKPGEFDDLPEKTKRRLVRLMARISEKSYRRGCQQALTTGCAHKSISDWRYQTLDKSQGVDTKWSVPVEERFWMNNRQITELGFRES